MKILTSETGLNFPKPLIVLFFTVLAEMPPSKTGTSTANVVEQSQFGQSSLRSDNTPSTGKILDECDSERRRVQGKSE